jgi:hypothetical protein
MLDEIARRRTFAIISHPDAGKTTLTEKFLLYGGAVMLAGSVRARKNQRDTTSDWMELEKRRGISVSSTVLQFEYRVAFLINRHVAVLVEFEVVEKWTISPIREKVDAIVRIGRKLVSERWIVHVIYKPTGHRVAKSADSHRVGVDCCKTIGVNRRLSVRITIGIARQCVAGPQKR